MVSVRSATSLRSSASNVVTGAAGVRKTGSPKSRMGWTVTELLTGGKHPFCHPRASADVGWIHPHPHRIGRLAGGASGLRDVQGVGERAAFGAGYAHQGTLADLVIGGRRVELDRPEHLRAGQLGRQVVE